MLTTSTTFPDGPRPCPSCGYCPTCGQRPSYQAQPLGHPWPWAPYTSGFVTLQGTDTGTDTANSGSTNQLDFTF